MYFYRQPPKTQSDAWTVPTAGEVALYEDPNTIIGVSTSEGNYKVSQCPAYESSKQLFQIKETEDQTNHAL